MYIYEKMKSEKAVNHKQFDECPMTYFTLNFFQYSSFTDE